LQWLTFSLGSGEYHSKPLSDAMQIVEEGRTTTGQPYRIIDLKEGDDRIGVDLSVGSGQ